MLFSRESAAALADRYHEYIRQMRPLRAMGFDRKANGVDFLLTGFRSFTQDASGRPLPNPSGQILERLKILARSEPEPAREAAHFAVGIITLAGYRCLTAVGNVDYATPPAFVELARFVRPRAVLNLGLGTQTSIESAALNQVNPARPSYDHDGVVIARLFPIGTLLDEALPQDYELPLPWTPATLARLRRVTTVAGTARRENDYLCNATAWLFARLMQPSKGEPQPLPWVTSTDWSGAESPGAESPGPEKPALKLLPHIELMPLTEAGIQQAGFLHLAPRPPQVSSNDYFLAATNLLVDVMRAILPDPVP